MNAECTTFEGVHLRELDRHRDGRGWLIELFRHDELDEAHWPAMAYVSGTLPGVVRGPREHVEFCPQITQIFADRMLAGADGTS